LHRDGVNSTLLKLRLYRITKFRIVHRGGAEDAEENSCKGTACRAPTALCASAVNPSFSILGCDSRGAGHDHENDVFALFDKGEEVHLEFCAIQMLV
jgi:hypothetical protein